MLRNIHEQKWSILVGWGGRGAGEYAQCSMIRKNADRRGRVFSLYVECDPFNFVGNGASIGNRIEEKLRE